MKKFLVVLVLLLVIFLSGCGSLSISDAGKNVNEYNLKLAYDDTNKELNGDEDISYINTSDNILKEVYFHLYPNAFRQGSQYPVVSVANYEKAYPNGASYGHIDILNVTSNSVPYEYYIGGYDDNILVVKLADELYPNDRIDLNIQFKVKLPNINHRFGYGENCINFGNFYPIACMFENNKFVTDPYSSNGDPFYSDIANYKATITFDKKFVIASTGEIKEEESGGNKIAKIEAKAVRDFMFVLSEKFKVIEEKCQGVNVKYYYYNDKSPEKSLKAGMDTIETNNQLIGKYPYSTLSVVESNFVHGGMEYPMIVLISDEIEDNSTYLNVIIHEVSHQWWYAVVGNNQYSHGWLDEGLTEYTTAVFYEKNEGYDLDKDIVISNGVNSYTVFVKVYKSVYGSIDTSMTRSLGEFQTEPEYVYIAYLKGMLMFDSLRNILGEDLFFKCLKTYYSEYAFKEAKPENLICVFERVCGRNLETFFDSWINGEVVIMNG